MHDLWMRLHVQACEPGAEWWLCSGLWPACCATTVELSCLACHLIDGPEAFNVLQPQPAKTKLHKNDTREESP